MNIETRFPRLDLSAVVLSLVAAILCGCAGNSAPPAQKDQSQWVFPGPDGKLKYKTTANGDRIMDFSSAGYMGGGVALPIVPVKLTVRPSGGPDDTPAIQNAINKVATMPLNGSFRGAVLLAPGTFTCSNTIVISSNGVVLRGSGSGKGGTTIKMAGGRHGAIALGGRRGGGGGRGGRGGRGGGPATASDQTETDQLAPSAAQGAPSANTTIADAYVPCGAMSFTVADATGFAVGDTIEIQRPVTEAWIKFMQMDNLSRNNRPQNWIRAGSAIYTQRRITAVAGNKITLDIPLTDSFDARCLNPPGTAVAKIRPPARLTQSGVERLHIQAPPMEMSYQQAPYTAMRINGEDLWARDVLIEETMNSVSIGGRRITLEQVAIKRTVPNLGASKPAEFAPNASQVLLDRCSSDGDNIWHAATGAGQTGPIVFLNCSFGGNGHIEGHQRWTTGMLLDNCRLPDGGIDFKDRGAMGSGHGWGTGWSVAWNCLAKTFVVQQPPGACNWMIGCIGTNVPTPQPFDTAPALPLGISDSQGRSVKPQSLYLAQLAERLGPQALRNIGYAPAKRWMFFSPTPLPAQISSSIADKDLGPDVALHRLVNTSNVRRGARAFAGEMAVDGNNDTYWATDNGVTQGWIELDLEGPQEINACIIEEATGFGRRVLSYKVEGQVDSAWKLLAQSTTIGDRKADYFPKVIAWKVRLTILSATDYPAIRRFSIYNAKKP